MLSPPCMLGVRCFALAVVAAGCGPGPRDATGGHPDDGGRGSAIDSAPALSEGCGNLLEPCCGTGSPCAAALSCEGAVCIGCGYLDEPCCEGACVGAELACVDRTCRPGDGIDAGPAPDGATPPPPPTDGGMNGPDAGSPPPPPPAGDAGIDGPDAGSPPPVPDAGGCGGLHEPCCSGGTCEGSLVCYTAVCVDW